MRNDDMKGDEVRAPGMLDGRNAIVTGGSRGLGRAIADRLYRAGAEVTIIDLGDALSEAEMPADWRTSAVDLAANDAEARLSDLASGFGTVDVLVANAGLVPPWRRVSELDRDEWTRVFSVNVWGAAATLKTFAQNLAQADKPSVILMASLNGYKAHPDQTLYTASKHAVVGLMRAAAQDLGRDGVRVNALAPGPIPTEALIERINSRSAAGGMPADVALKGLAEETFLGQIATPEMVADAAFFLASDLSAGMTGTVLPINCGLA